MKQSNARLLSRPAADSKHARGKNESIVLSWQERVGRLVTGLSLLPHPVHAWNRLPTDLKLLRSTASFNSKLKSFLFHATYTGNTVWTLECAIGLLVGGALQVSVVNVTVTVTFRTHSVVSRCWWWWWWLQSADTICTLFGVYSKLLLQCGSKQLKSS